MSDILQNTRVRFDVRRVDDRVALLVDGEPVVGGAWRPMEHLARHLFRSGATISTSSPVCGPVGGRRYQVERDGLTVGLIVEGRLVFRVPPEVADAVGRGLLEAVRYAEAHEKREQVARDQAILTRAGATVGLSSDPAVLDEAAKRAAWDRECRQMPSIEPRSAVGTPTIVGDREKVRTA